MPCFGPICSHAICSLPADVTAVVGSAEGTLFVTATVHGTAAVCPSAIGELDVESSDYGVAVAEPSVEMAVSVRATVIGVITVSGFYIGEDLTVSITGLRDSYDDTYLNTATVTAELKDTSGTSLGSAATLSFQAATDGNYKGVIDHLEGPDDMVCGTLYDIWVTVVQGDYNGLRRLRKRAEYHSYTP